MGDRAHIKVEQGYGDVYLYTHWGGYKIEQDIKDGLHRGHNRWDDPDYLTRILFDAMKGSDVTGETGFGISASVPDGSPWVVNVPDRTVTNPEGRTMTFEDCVK
jgi:hypothetical protein